MRIKVGTAIPRSRVSNDRKRYYPSWMAMVLVFALSMIQFRDAAFVSKKMMTSTTPAPRNKDKDNDDGTPSVLVLEPFATRGAPVVDRNTTKKNLIFHIGPPKTGSTTIQCLMREQEFTLLRQDGYSLMETEACRPKGHGKLEVSPLVGNGYLPKCLQQVDGWYAARLRTINQKTAASIFPPPDCWVEYLQLINQQYEAGNHVILSNENIATNLEYISLDVIIEDLAGRFDIHFVAVYRHYFDWIASFYNQEFKKIWTKRRKFGEWQGRTKRAMAMPRIIEYALEAVAKGKRGELDQLIPIYKSKADNIRFTVLDMHHGDKELTTSQSARTSSATTPTLEIDFFCNAVPGMLRMCGHFLSAANLQEKRKNPSSRGVIAYDRVATAAYARGWIKPNVSRTTAALAARTFHLKTLNASSTAGLPQICPSDQELRVLWDRSLLYAQRIFPSMEHALDNLEKHLQRGWDRAITKQTLCGVDVELVLLDPRWEEFFKTITPKTRPDELLDTY